MTDTEALARELHDVAFAWNHSLPTWGSLPDAQQEWFRDRAEKMAAAGWGLMTGEARSRLPHNVVPLLRRAAAELHILEADALELGNLPTADEADSALHRHFSRNPL